MASKVTLEKEMEEAILWHDASVEQPTNHADRLLVISDGQILIGQFFGEWADANNGHCRLDHVTFWAELPTGPQRIRG
jgi:hypothetical protein